MPHPWKLPAWYEDGLSRAHIPASPKEHCWRLYFEAIYTAIGCLKDRFDQAGYPVYHNLEELLIKASLKENFESQFKFICEHYKDVLNPDVLHSQLLAFGNHFQSTSERPISPSVFDIKDFFVKLSTAQKDLPEQDGLVLKLSLVMPATNATSKRTFNSHTWEVRWLKIGLTIYCYKEHTDSLDLKSIINRFIARCETRRNTFSTFWVTKLIL